jgi:hypothetical protein
MILRSVGDAVGLSHGDGEHLLSYHDNVLGSNDIGVGLGLKDHDLSLSLARSAAACLTLEVVSRNTDFLYSLFKKTKLGAKISIVIKLLCLFTQPKKKNQFSRNIDLFTVVSFTKPCHRI